MKKTLTTFFKKFGVISGTQFEFQVIKTTLDALLHRKDNILTNVEDQTYILGLFIDLKTFHAVSRKILLEKLKNYGIRGPAL